MKQLLGAHTYVRTSYTCVLVLCSDVLPTSALLLSQLLDSNEELQELLKEEGFVAVKQIVENHPVVSPPHTGVVWCGVEWCGVVWHGVE